MTSGPLQRLLDNEVLGETNIGASTLVAFAQDPIEEYVAAFAHAQECGKDEKLWCDLWEKVSALLMLMPLDFARRYV